MCDGIMRSYGRGSIGYQGEDYARLGPQGQARICDSTSRCGDHSHARRGREFLPTRLILEKIAEM
ncbi:uncharacterized protein [Physcomitrium patens]|uniref:uncharacterized protein isoform X2 n=1 Tax=Physcomitrium patens TaxID=3218 RepID=UPI003CCD515C